MPQNLTWDINGMIIENLVCTLRSELLDTSNRTRSMPKALDGRYGSEDFSRCNKCCNNTTRLHIDVATRFMKLNSSKRNKVAPNIFLVVPDSATLLPSLLPYIQKRELQSRSVEQGFWFMVIYLILGVPVFHGALKNVQ